MNKNALVLERAMLRIAEAEKCIREEQRKVDTVNTVANRIAENDVYFFLDPDSNELVIASLKSVETIH